LSLQEESLKVESTGLFFTCCYCRGELNESQIFDFRGSVGCEKCVRDYYRNRSTNDIESQLRTRRSSAVRWLNRNRKALEKAAKIPPKKPDHGSPAAESALESKNVGP
jgi:hypothetical protein